MSRRRWMRWEQDMEQVESQRQRTAGQLDAYDEYLEGAIARSDAREEAQDRLVELSAAQIERQNDQLARWDAILDKHAALVDRWSALADRVDGLIQRPGRTG